MQRLIGALLAMALSMACSAEDVYVNAQVAWHPAVLDGQGRLLGWYHPEKNLGYDKVLHLGWDFIEHKVPKDTRHGTGLKIYLINSVFDGKTLQGSNWQHNPAMVFASFVDSLVGWYPYSGDQEAVEAVRGMLDHQLAHGTTPAGWEWPGVPFATNCDDQPDYGHCIQDMPHEFYGGVETDKVGELGTGYALFYKLTGDRKYLDAAIRCADSLAKHVRPGDATHTPWPFRVDARTGVTLALEEYGGDVAGPLRLFEQLMLLKAGNVEAYRKARDVAWHWMMSNLFDRESPAWNKWSGFFEDVPRHQDNVNQYTPMMAAYYILAREDPAEIDPQWMGHVGRLLDWVRFRFGRGPFFGAQAIDEQSNPDSTFGCCSRAGQGDHTARWAAINAMFFEKTRDGQARDDAFRSLNYSTYFAGSDGRIACCGVDYTASYWFSDGYSDYMRHFQWAMGAIPEFAPAGQDHILRSSSVVQTVKYGERHVTYRTFDPDATEVLRLSFKAARVTAGGASLAGHSDLKTEGYTLRPLSGGDWVLRIRHVRSGEVSVQD
ncbi:MAG TPA: hypothetical protein VMG35_07480 [Bryobacteraceae bacterium]|nr:hypothetical protein [Bryobacteraceae bacterium]